MDSDFNMAGMYNNSERKLAKFLIMFDNSNLLYFPGQFLSGRVIVELQDEMAITGKAHFNSKIFNLDSVTRQITISNRYSNVLFCTFGLRYHY